MIILKMFANLIIFLIGLEFIVSALRDKKSNYYPKWLWICQLIVGSIGSLYSFSVWFIN